MCCDKRHPQGQTTMSLRTPARTRRRFNDPAALYPAIFDVIEPSISFQSFTNDPAASRWRSVASLSQSIPAFVNFAIITSASPPSASMGSPTEPWSAKASRVLSGIVLTVKGSGERLDVENV